MRLRLEFVLANCVLAAGLIAILALVSRPEPLPATAAVTPLPRAETNSYGTLWSSDTKAISPIPSMMSHPLLIQNSTMGVIAQSFSTTSRALQIADGPISHLDGPEIEEEATNVGVESAPRSDVVPPTGRRNVAFDASEGTKLDPLKQKNWDLNATHVLPRLK